LHFFQSKLFSWVFQAFVPKTCNHCAAIQK
jgi:hypothetical protein